MAPASRDAIATAKGDSSPPPGSNFAPTGSAPMAALLPGTTPSTSAQDAERRITELSSVLEHRRSSAHTPLRADAWLATLAAANLLSKYPLLPSRIKFGFNASIPPIPRTYAPSNNLSIPEHAHAFNQIVQKEFSCGRYIGPLSGAEVERLLGPFQTSPISMVPKPGKPGKFRLVQNLSFPRHPLESISSINSAIDSNLYPCTWGTFATICLLIWRLPPGSQAAVRDVSEAYRSIPIIPEQWPGLVVRLEGHDRFAIDTCDCFGLASGAGIYGEVGDAGADIFRAAGIGPLSKWVDDHIFFRILRQYLDSYNTLRERTSLAIAANSGKRHDGGRLWYRGDTMPDGRLEEFDEDMQHPIRDLSSASPRSPADALYTCTIADVDRISVPLGYRWEASKDIPFCSRPLFIGFEWDLTACEVSLPDSKKQKYLNTIEAWLDRRAHALEEVRKLYGKLLHASLVLPAGRAYLTKLEAMLSLFDDRPFMPRTPPRGTSEDLLWWIHKLRQPTLSRPIPGPHELRDTLAFSDASSGVGIGIIISGRWRAWRLLPNWNTDGRNIGWAEAVGLELLIRALVPSSTTGLHYKVYGDNRGVVEGWWKGRSRNKPTNEVFKRLHELSESSGCTYHTRYVPSASNPADGPSRGIYPPLRLLLPAICIPTQLRPFIADFDADLLPAERRLLREGTSTTRPPKSPRERAADRTINDELQHQGDELLAAYQLW